MTSQVKQLYEIVQGPDRLNILMAFAQYGKHAYRSPGETVVNSPDLVFFVSKDVLVKHAGSANPYRAEEVSFYVTVSGIQQAGGTGRDWNLEGCLMTVMPQPHLLEWDFRRARRVHIEYHTGTKKGMLVIFP